MASPPCLIAINDQGLTAIGTQQDAERFDVNVTQLGYAFLPGKPYDLICIPLTGKTWRSDCGNCCTNILGIYDNDFSPNRCVPKAVRIGLDRIGIQKATTRAAHNQHCGQT